MQSSKQSRVREYRIGYVAAVRYYAMTKRISIHEAFKQSLRAFSVPHLPPFSTFHAFENFYSRYHSAVDTMLDNWEQSGVENEDSGSENGEIQVPAVIGRDILAVFKQLERVDKEEIEGMSITSMERERLIDGAEQRGFLNRVLAFVPTLVRWVQSNDEFAVQVCRFYAIHHYGGEEIPMYS